MKTPDTSDYGRILALCGWEQAQQAILSGLVHDLNGRITALGALAQLADLGEALPGGLAGEDERLRSLSADFQLLLGDLGDRRRPIMPADLLQTVIRLASRAMGALSEPIPVQVQDRSTVPPVLVQEAAMVRGLSAFLVSHGAERTGDLQIVLTGDSDAVVRISGCDLDDSDATLALKDLVMMEGGTVTADATGLEIRLPSLQRSRDEGR